MRSITKVEKVGRKLLQRCILSPKMLTANTPSSTDVWPFRTSLLLLVIFCSLFLVSLFYFSRLRMFAADDAFIHRRIAEHLLDTGHAYFNINERVMVTSSPLWTILLALLTATRHLDTAIVGVESLCLAAASTLAMVLALGATAKQPTWIRIFVPAVAVLCTFAVLLQSGVQQMETPLACLLLLGSLWLLDVGSDTWLAVLVLAANTRYEVNLLLPMALVGLYCCAR